MLRRALDAACGERAYGAMGAAQQSAQSPCRSGQAQNDGHWQVEQGQICRSRLNCAVDNESWGQTEDASHAKVVWTWPDPQLILPCWAFFYGGARALIGRQPSLKTPPAAL